MLRNGPLFARCAIYYPYPPEFDALNPLRRKGFDRPKASHRSPVLIGLSASCDYIKNFMCPHIDPGFQLSPYTTLTPLTLALSTPCGRRGSGG